MNLKLSILMVFVFVVLSACSSANQQTEPGTPVLIALTPEPTTPTSQALPTSTSTITLFQMVDGTAIKAVSLSQLQLDRSVVIFAAKPMYSKLFQLSSPLFGPKPVSIISPNARAEMLKFSPNRKWLIYFVFTFKDQDNLAHYDVWLGSTTDQNQQSLIIKSLPGNRTISWLNNEKILLAYYGRNFDCPADISIMDPFLNTEQKLPDLLEVGRNSCFLDSFLNSDFSKAIYLNQDAGWKQLDYASMSTLDIFPTLKENDLNIIPPKYLFWGASGLSLAFPASNSIRFARNLDETEIVSLNQFGDARLPENMTIIYEYFPWWNLEKGLVAFDLKKNVGAGQTVMFAIANLDDLTVKNYEIDRNLFLGNIGTAIDIVATRDGRFLSWAVLKLPDNHPVLGSVILDTKTGEASFLKDYQILGFGESEP